MNSSVRWNDEVVGSEHLDLSAFHVKHPFRRPKFREHGGCLGSGQQNLRVAGQNGL
jgi:hypothetical protein